MIYFTTEQDFRKRTNIHKNVDWSEINPNISEASNIYVRPILGKEFYDHLLTAYNGSTLKADEKKLVDIIQLIVAYRATDLALTWITFKPTNKGLQQQFGENSQSATLEMLKYVRNQAKNMATIHENELKKTLERDRKLYPIYEKNSNKDIVAPSEPEDNTGFDIF